MRIKCIYYIKCYLYFLIFKVVLFMVDILINIEFHCHQTKFLQRCKPYQQPSYQDLLRHSYQKLLRRLDPHLDSMWLMRSVCLLAVHARARLLIALNPQWAILSFFWMVTKVIWRTQRKIFHCLTKVFKECHLVKVLSFKKVNTISAWLRVQTNS